ncbi:MAG: anaerobic c4-dicarboxylate antiporter, DcuC family [Firmicutes bacterium]|nr:anaerobic c4-dicarboxylate antiporter, DcuC family [Bacillota bacterium]
MLGLIIALLVVTVCGYLIIKKYKAQAVLICGGFIMMAVAIIFNFGPIVPAKLSTGFSWFDMFKFVDELASKRTAELGLMIMVCAGFAKYMEKIGASRAMVHVAVKPLSLLRSPYLVLCGGFLIGQVLHPFIPSASGFGMLLMVTMYPIYISLGISRTAATAVIGTNGCLDLGPASGNSILAAKYAGISAVDYFVKYQLPPAIAISLVLVVCHYFVQRWFDKKYEGGLAQGFAKQEVAATTEKDKEEPLPPLFYAILPAVPLLLMLVFGYFKFQGIKMDINVALFIGFAVAMMAEFFRVRDLKKVLSSMQIFFDGMGVQFATVVTLIVAGETFAKGLTSLGAIDTLIYSAQSAGFGKDAMIVLMSGIITASSLVMGSGNAPFFAFSSFAPDVAAKVGAEAVNFLLPMQLSASVARAMCPITAVIVAISGVAGVSPFDVVKRTAIPLTAGLLTVQIVTFFMF